MHSIPQKIISEKTQSTQFSKAKIIYILCCTENTVEDGDKTSMTQNTAGLNFIVFYWVL